MFSKIFGSPKDEIWRQLAEDMGGHYNENDWLGADKLTYCNDDWEMALDTFEDGWDESSLPNTRMRAPFLNKFGLEFKIYRSGFFSNLATKVLNLQDIEIGEPDFDEKFIIKSNSEAGVRKLLAPAEIRALIDTQPAIALAVHDDVGTFKKRYPEKVDVLHFHCLGVIKDEERLRSLFELFVAVLNRLQELNHAEPYQRDAGPS